MSRKSERLVNLTIALLATSRWLTKSEIYRTIDGYSGDLDAKERMFERDKEELRNLGIEIEVGSFDPLFEDEVGYRIRPEKYKIQISNLSELQFSLISLATHMWRGAVLSSQANSALLKLKSLGIESDAEGLSLNPQRLDVSDENLLHIIDAISSKKVISFGYFNRDSVTQDRAIEPLGVGTKNGFWYVAGRDLDKKEIRLFRLDRFSSAVKDQGRAGAFDAPTDFAMSDLLQSQARNNLCRIKVRTDKAHALRKFSSVISSDDDWDLLDLSYATQGQLIRDLLWHRDDVEIIGPDEIVVTLRSALERIEALHG
ncbi:COG2378 Predicted transcriptional regulator [Candidatus Nanopelagicaceae bacterium]